MNTQTFLRIIKYKILFTLTISMTSCAYLEDRRQDLTDAVHLNFNTLGVGASLNAGPAIVGFHEIDGFGNKGGDRYKLGLGGVQHLHERGETAGFIIPFSYSEIHEYKDSKYKELSPALGSVGFDLGFIISFGARVDLIETADFILGLFYLDILNDDEAAKAEKSPPKSETKKE